MNYMIEIENGISNYFFCESYKGPFFAPHIHSHIEFVFVLSGKVSMTITDKSFEITEGHVAVIMPYEIHAYEADEACQTFVIACPAEYFNEYKPIIINNIFEPPFAKFNDGHIAIIEEVKKDNFQKDLKKKALIYYTLSTFLQECFVQEKKVFEYDLYRKTVVYISEHFTDDITLEKAALFARVTPTHLSRVLNREGKPGFSEIVNSLRAYYSKQLLEQTDLSVSQVAFEAGFGSIRNFNRIFKRFFGSNPTEVRK